MGSIRINLITPLKLNFYLDKQGRVCYLGEMPRPKLIPDQPSFDLSDLNDLRKAIEFHKEQGARIISLQKNIEEYYAEWEDYLVKIDRAIAQAAEEHGITEQEVVEPPEYDALTKFL